ncbi:MAG: 6-pyruvoyl trahydropterin synthase family protein [Rhodopila sp.]
MQSPVERRAVSLRALIVAKAGLRIVALHGAQALHGATYVVDVEFRCAEISDDGVVVDIGRAHAQLKATLAELNHRNLNEAPMFAGKNMTTKFLARHIFMRLREATRDGELSQGARTCPPSR